MDTGTLIGAADWHADRRAMLALVRPRLVSLGLVVIGLTYALAAPEPAWAEAFWLAVGSTAALAGATVFNQLVERETDGLMRRTMDRPIPAGKVSPTTAAGLGAVLTVAGLALLWRVEPLAAASAGAGWFAYVAIYTPMKTRSRLATVVGAVPGAVPVLIGWAAARGDFGLATWALFAILFLWQLPHFLAIAWMYRADYARAGLRMLPGSDTDGDATARQIAGYGAALVPVSLLPTMVDLAGPTYFVGALVLGTAYLACGLDMGRKRTSASAKRLLRASVLYLPLLLGLLLVDSRWL